MSFTSGLTDLRPTGPPEDGDIAVWDGRLGQWILTQLDTSLSGAFIGVPQAADQVIYLGSGSNANDSNNGLTAYTAKATLQGALNALPAGGGIVKALHGSFSGDVTFPALNNVTIEGIGPTTVFTTTKTTGNSMAFSNAISGITLRDFAFSCSGTGGCTGIYTNVSTDVLMEGLHLSGTFAQSILVYQGGRVRITGCNFDSIGLTSGSTPGDAINVFTATGVTIDGNTFNNCKQDACYFNATTTDCTFVSNTVIGSPEGVQVRSSCARITISGNSFNLTGSSVVNSFGIDVDTSCTDTVIADNTIFCQGATNISRAIQVQESCHRTIITGNTITGPQTNQAIYVHAASTGSLDCVIANNTVNGAGDYGIDVGSLDLRTVVVGNTVRGRTGNTGINVAAADCIVANNTVSGGGSHGIGVSGASAAITGNLCISNTGNGIVMVGNDQTVVGNVCISNAGANGGIQVANCSGCTVTANRCTGNTGPGIQEFGTANSNLIANNSLAGNTGGALTIVGAATIARGNLGYNPVGTVSPSVPASGSAVAASPYDRTFYVTTGAGATTMAISGGPTITLAASVAGQTVRVPAGTTLTPTYANAPTWVVEGE